MLHVAAEELRAIFDQDAELYDRARPSYPYRLISDLAELAEIGPGTRLAEVGPGTGQATAALTARGAHVVCVELGPKLAAVLYRKLAHTSVEVVVSAFEDWPLPKEPFDALCAFTAWHWLDSDVRTIKAAAALRSGGALATVTTAHVLGCTDAFSADAQICYQRWDPATHQAQNVPTVEAVPAAVDEVDASELFLPAAHGFSGSHHDRTPGRIRGQAGEVIGQRSQARAGSRVIGLRVGAVLALTVVVAAGDAVECRIDHQAQGGVHAGLQRAHRTRDHLGGHVGGRVQRGGGDSGAG